MYIEWMNGLINANFLNVKSFVVVVVVFRSTLGCIDTKDMEKHSSVVKFKKYLFSYVGIPYQYGTLIKCHMS